MHCFCFPLYSALHVLEIHHLDSVYVLTKIVRTYNIRRMEYQGAMEGLWLTNRGFQG